MVGGGGHNALKKVRGGVGGGTPLFSHRYGMSQGVGLMAVAGGGKIPSLILVLGASKSVEAWGSLVFPGGVPPILLYAPPKYSRIEGIDDGCGGKFFKKRSGGFFYPKDFRCVCFPNFSLCPKQGDFTLTIFIYS